VTRVSDLETRADEYRDAFDRSFALPYTQLATDLHDVLAIRVAGASYGIRLRHAAGVVTQRRVVPLPSAAPHLLGIAGIRGGVVPVFCLASILGHGSPREPPRWLVLCGTHEPIALGFADLDGHLRVPGSAFHSDPGIPKTFVSELASTDTGVLAVVDLSLVGAHLGLPNVEDPSKGGR